MTPSVKPISTNIHFTYIENTNNKVQMSITQWYQDYPAAVRLSLYAVRLRFASVAGSDSSLNIAGFCDKDINAKMDASPGPRRRPIRPAPTRCGPRSTRQ